MRRVVLSIGKSYSLHFEEEEVNSVKAIEELIKKGIINSPGMLINAIVANNYYKNSIPNSKKAELMEKKLNNDFNKIKLRYYEENGILENENPDWEKINKDLLNLSFKSFSSHIK